LNQPQSGARDTSQGAIKREPKNSNCWSRYQRNKKRVG
jgi:hypothetical protein